MKQRLFGKTGIAFSPVILGSMRFTPERVGSISDGVAFLQFLYEEGINSYHTSHEYETHEYFCEVFRAFKMRMNEQLNTAHIVKLACPHFEERDFDSQLLEQRIDEQLKALQIESIDCVQWLFRQKNNVDEVRVPKFLSCVDEISETFQKLIQSGKVRAFGSFPYSEHFADVVHKARLVDGFIDYLNVMERQWADKLIHGDYGSDQGFIAIRPLFAGKAIFWLQERQERLKELMGEQPSHEDRVRWAIKYPLLNSSVSSVIFTMSNQAQARIGIQAQQEARIDNVAFERISALLGSLDIEVAECTTNM